MDERARPGPLQTTVRNFIAATNAFDIEAALALFAPSAVIEDPSTGRAFERQAGVRDYLARYFVGYRTVTRLLSLQPAEGDRIRARVDFKGDFGHEFGRLAFTVDPRGRIVRIEAGLE